MEDVDTVDQLGLDLAAAQHSDDMDLCKLLLSILVLRKAGKINAEIDESYRKQERKILYHEPKLYAPRASIRMPGQSNWHAALHSVNESDGLWVKCRHWLQLIASNCHKLQLLAILDWLLTPKVLQSNCTVGLLPIAMLLHACPQSTMSRMPMSLCCNPTAPLGLETRAPSSSL